MALYVTGESNPNFHEIKGKKVMGVGLGDIFQHGPIKLRNTKKPEPAKPSKPDDKVRGVLDCSKLTFVLRLQMHTCRHANI